MRRRGGSMSLKKKMLLVTVLRRGTPVAREEGVWLLCSAVGIDVRFRGQRTGKPLTRTVVYYNGAAPTQLQNARNDSGDSHLSNRKHTLIDPIDEINVFLD